MDEVIRAVGFFLFPGAYDGRTAAGSGAVWECAVTGVTPTLIRCPYGEYDDHVIAAIRSMGIENDDYTLTKRELIELDMTDVSIYQYEFYPQKVELVPEPDNPHDPNAIKVVTDGIHIGYIRAKDCEEVKGLLDSGDVVNIKADIDGGPYRCITEDDDGEYQEQKGFDQFTGAVRIFTPNPDYDPALDPANAPKKEETKAFGLSTADNHYTKRGRIVMKILLGILAAMALLLAFVFPVMLVVSLGCILTIIFWKPKK